ncbi:MAG TPA: ABATE domain-containing protein [Gammaproteobacteria bacterium]|nr:ABATE domain-containing protein [Gammaproteobacteria bacterium]
MRTHPLPEDRDGFRFRGGANVIDLPATLQARLSPEPRELLAAPADLARWLVSAGLATSTPEVSAEDLAVARTLREAIYVLAGTRSGSEAKAARDHLNGIAAGTPAIPRLGDDGSLNLVGPAAALLVTLAREAVQLFGGDDVGLIRQCHSPTCTLYFIDTSRRGDRQWCSMSACGNKAKAAGFRRRQRKKQRTR